MGIAELKKAGMDAFYAANLLAVELKSCIRQRDMGRCLYSSQYI